MASTFFFTGFPGFLGTELIAALLPARPEIQALCLIQGKYRSNAEAQRTDLIRRHPSLQNRIHFVEGDITTPGLGLAMDTQAIQQIFHLAAVYDLSVLPEIAHKINVVGTEHLVAFAKTCPRLQRFHYMSTCYVSGKYKGDFSEADLDKGQAFNNFYEETKFLAEVEVQGEMKLGFPATIYRPSVVVGNSQTGETLKYDGPYCVLQWLLRQPKVALLPSIGNPKKHTINVVPSDFVIQSMCYLSQREDTAGQIFHLSDPHPLTVAEFVRELGRVTQKKILSVPLPLSLAKFSLEGVPGLESYLKIPVSALDYFVHPTQYRSDLTQSLLKEGKITTPSFIDYSEKLVQFMSEHPDLRTQAMT